MKPRLVVTVLYAVMLSGCLSHEGTYLPGCIAYAGNKITLSGDRFVWEKFTDSVVVDDAGEVVNQFPGYPLRGTYRIDGQTLYMKSDGGESLENMYLHQRDNRQYLLTAEQFAAWENTGKDADCALLLSGNTDD